MDKTYRGWQEWANSSLQKEYTDPTPLLAEDGSLLAKGWARKNVFQYDRNRVKHVLRRKEWDFYQISDGHFMAQVSFANISLGGYASAVLVDLNAGKTISSSMAPFIGGKDRYVLPSRGDVPKSEKLSLKSTPERRGVPFVMRTGMYTVNLRWIFRPGLKTLQRSFLLKVFRIVTS